MPLLNPPIVIKADIREQKIIKRPVVTQNDSVILKLEILENGVPYDLTGATTVSLANKRKSDSVVVVTPGTFAGNIATFNLGTNELAKTGEVYAKAQFYDADDRVSTLTFSYVVEGDPTGAGYVPSVDEMTLIEAVMNDAQQKIDELSQVDVVDLAAQLVDMGEGVLEVENKLSPTSNFSGGIVTLLDDDGVATYLSRWKTVADTQGIKMSLAINTGQTGGSNMTLAQLQQLKAEGFDLLSHCHTHANLNTMSLADLETEYQTSLAYLKDNNLGDDLALVYPSGLASITDPNKILAVKNLTRKYFDYGIDDRGNVNYLPVDSYEVKRRNFTFGVDTFASMQQFIDEANTNKQWLIILTHSGANWDATVANQIVDYVQSINMPIMTFRDAEELVGNTLSQGDTRTPNYNFVAKNGAAKSSSSPIVFRKSASTNTFLQPITDFEENKVTYSEIPSTNDTVSGNGGVLVTYNGGTGLSYQTFRPANKNEFHTRSWRDYNTTWSEFVQFSPSSSQSTDMNKAITTYAQKVITRVQLASGVDTLLGAGGTMEVYRGDSDVYSYALLFPAGTNDVYKRRVSAGAWTAWERVNQIKSGTTGTRPTQSLTIGYSYFDTTLGKPIWYNGTVWKDATGTTV